MAVVGGAATLAAYGFVNNAIGAAVGAVIYAEGERLSSEESLNQRIQSNRSVQMIIAAVELVAGAMFFSASVVLLTGQVAYLPIVGVAAAALGLIRAIYKLYNFSHS